MDYETIQETSLVKVAEDYKNNPPALDEIVTIIDNRIRTFTEYERRVNQNLESAKKTKTLAQNLSGFKQKKFLWIKYKSGSTKDNIEASQDVVKQQSEVIASLAEANQAHLQFTKDLAKCCEYLFGLGCYNIAYNEAMIADLNQKLNGSSKYKVKLSSAVKEQFKNLVERLVQQRNVLMQQQEQKRKLKEQGKTLTEQANSIYNLQRELEKKDTLDKEQSNDIQLLKERQDRKDILDEQQSIQLNQHEEIFREINVAIYNLKKQLKQQAFSFGIVLLVELGLILYLYFSH